MRTPAKPLLFFLSLLWAWTGVPVAQLPDHYVKMLTEQQGLHAAEFISIAKDREGCLWLVSQSGVQRSDGRRSWLFTVNEGAEEIAVDNRDRKWLITRWGVYRFENAYKGFAPVPHAAPSETNAVCVFNAAGGLYLLLSNGLQVYDEARQRFTKTNVSFGVRGNISSVYAANDDYLFFATADSVYSFAKQTHRLHAVGLKRPASMVALTGNRLLVSSFGFKTYLVQTEPASTEEISANENMRFTGGYFHVYKGVSLQPNVFLIASNKGLLEFDAQTKRFRRPLFYLRGEKLENTLSVRWLFRDEQGTVYMSHADGVAFYNPAQSGIRYLRNYRYGRATLPEIDVRSFAEDPNGTVWIATLNGLAGLDPATGRLQTPVPKNKDGGLDYPSLRHLLFHRNRLWVGTSRKGIWLFNPATNSYSRPVFEKDSAGRDAEAKLNNDFIWRMVALQNGDVFVAGGSHCYRVGKDLKVSLLNHQVFSGISRSAVQDSVGRIWHGTSRGLNCTDDRFGLLFRMRDSFPDKRVAAFCEWKKNRMFVGTKGLYEVVVDNNKVTAFRQMQGIPANRFIYALEKDNAGNVWLATDEGLIRYAPESGTAETFDAADNVQPQAFNSNGLYLASSGWLYAGGKSGLNYFDPLQVKKNTRPLQPRIASLSVSNDDSSYFLQRGELTVPYFGRNLSAEISVPEFEKPFALLYRYRLNDELWVANGNSPFVRLNNLSPGRYRLAVSASRDGTTWYSSTAAVSFRVQTPWWLRWWFFGLVAFFLAAAGWTLVRARRQRRQRLEHQKIIDYFSNSGYEHSSVEDILWDIARNCISRLGFEECVIYLLDAKRQVLVQKAAYGPKNPRVFEIVNPIEIPLGKGITGFVAASGVAEIVNDTAKDPRYLVDDEARQSEITVPVVHKGEVIAVIDAESRRKNFFRPAHLETLQTIAAICAVKIARGLAMQEMQKAEKMLGDLNSKMLETKFLNLRLQMNPHFLFNALSSIQHLVVSQQTKEAYSYLSVFSNFLRSVLQYADKNVIRLEDELAMLNMYVKLEQLGSDKIFSYSVEVDDQLEAEDVMIPPLMIQPLVENAIWHGLMQKDGERRLSVVFRNQQDENLVCVVDDNGVGRKAAAALRQGAVNSFAHQSKATKLIRERLELLQQKTGKPATLEVEDKTELDGPTGTRVKISIPFYSSDDV